MAPIDISVLVITRNRREMVLDALESLTKCERSAEADFIVVDNHSDDGTAKAISAAYPGVRLVVAESNLGVSRGRDLGIEQAHRGLILCMDDDALAATATMLVDLQTLFDRQPQVAVAALRIVNHQRDVMLPHEFPKRGHAMMGCDSEQDVAYFVGCGFCVRRDVYLNTGGFCRQMLYGPEEVDFSYRVLKAGYRIRYFPRVCIRHRAETHLRRKGAWFENEIHARLLLAMRNLPWWAATVYLGIWHLRLLGGSLLSRSAPSYLRGLRKGWRDAWTFRQQRCPLSVSMAWRIHQLGGRLFY